MKKFKKAVSLVLAGAMVLSMAACGGSSSSSSSDNGAAAGGSAAESSSNSEYRVAMITDSGDITDQSFNQTTYEACKAFCEANGVDFTYKKPDGDTDDARIAMVDAAVGEGYNVVVMPGYLFAGAIVECTSKYPDVKFIALDMSAGDILGAALGDQYDYNPANWNISDYYNTDNTYCAVYQEELPGYMAGYAAVKMGYTKLGFLGGMEVPAVIRYGYGFVQGADAAAAELGNASDVSIEYAYGGQFYGSSEITAAMDTWYQNGTEVVFACGGGIYTSAAEAAAKVDGKLIGVDSDQAPIIDAYADGMTVTSAMKGLTATVNTILDSIIVSDTWSDHVGQIENLGLASGDDMSKNYVQLSDSTQWSDAFTEDDYKALVADMFSGKIKVDNTTENKPDVSVEVNYREGTIM
jgi:basic membrane protein A